MSTITLPSRRVLTISALALACLGTFAAPAQAESVSQLCPSTRVASTYLATSSRALPVTPLASSLKLTPCASFTGHGTAEISLVVSSKGDIVMAPVYTDHGPAALRSVDNGANWDAVIPLRADGTPHVRLQPFGRWRRGA